jgi:hypothetical protein
LFLLNALKVDGVNRSCGGKCVAGYEGDACDTETNECVVAGQPVCRNGGNCTDLLARYACTCTPPFAGVNCTVDVDECASVACLHGGTCQQLDPVALYRPGEPWAGFQCRCAPGYAGALCETDIDDCESQPCLNGGTCRDGVNQFTCTCAAGFTGHTCAEDIDECAPRPCQNGGLCTDGVNGFVCTCAAGYTGATCTVDVDDCAQGDTPRCLNGGTCVDGLNLFNCTCAPGFVGLRCETNVDDCASSPCSPDGSEGCVDGINDYACQCRAGYTGKNCQVLGTVSFSSNNAFLGYPTSMSGRSALSLSLEFVTTVGSGVLFYSTDPSGDLDFFAVELVSGALVVAVDLGTAPIVASAGRNLSDGRWHRVDVLVANASVTLTVDRGSCAGCHFTQFGDPRLTVLNVNGNMFFGGPSAFNTLTSRQLSVQRNFAGCMRDVALNGNAFNLAGPRLFNGVAAGCVQAEQCLTAPCGPRGVCLDVWDNFYCQCSLGVAGTRCSEFAPAVTLGGRDGIELQYVAAVGTGFTATFSLDLLFRTRLGGMLLYLSGDRVSNDYFSVVLEPVTGAVLVDMSLGDAPRSRLGTGVWNDGEWHHLRVTRETATRQLTVTIDKIETIVAVSSGSASTLNVDDGNLFIGAVTSAAAAAKVSARSLVNLTGCVTDLRYNDQPVPWASSDLFRTLSRNLRAGCDCGARLCGAADYCLAGVPGEACLPSSPNCTAVAEPAVQTCVPQRVCAAGLEFQTVAATGTSDRQCAALSVCNVSDSFEAVAATTTTDRVCRNLTQCTNGSTFAQALPTASSDRVCRNCTRCATGTYQQTACSPDQNTKCASCSVCELQVSFLASPCTLERNTDCQPCRRCEADREFQVRACDLRNDTVCEACTVCAEGQQYETRACSASSNRLCANCSVCAAGTFAQSPCTNKSNVRCAPCSTCAAGTSFRLSACTSAADTQCQLASVCNNLTEYEVRPLTATTDRECRALSNCTAGVQFQSSAPTATSDRVCAAIAAPCAGSDVFESRAPTATSDRVCSACRRCLLGEYVASRCSGGTDTDCRPCVCANGGLCIANVAGTGFSCTCAPGWTGPDCTVETDECASSPCLNSGTCVDRFRNFTCTCAAGFTGPTCAVNVDDCLAFGLRNFSSTGRFEEPCVNGGTCVDGIGNFTCNCLPGFTGARCERTEVPTDCVACFQGQSYQAEACSSQPTRKCLPCTSCSTGAYQQTVCSLAGGNTRCAPLTTCVAGQTYQQAAPTATTDRVCSPCAVCNSTQIQQSACTVAANTVCRTRTCDRVCVNGGSCVLSPTTGAAVCVCPEGFAGPTCALPSCSADPCRVQQAQAIGCLPHPTQGYQCLCPPGWTGTGCTTRESACRSNPCFNNGVCDGLADGSFVCACVNGYVGSTCQELASLAAGAEGSGSDDPDYDRIAIYVAIAAGIVVLLLIVATVAIACRSRSRGGKSSFAPGGGRRPAEAMPMKRML